MHFGLFARIVLCFLTGACARACARLRTFLRACRRTTYAFASLHPVKVAFPGIDPGTRDVETDAIPLHYSVKERPEGTGSAVRETTFFSHVQKWVQK